jgi:hypothetical protein
VLPDSDCVQLSRKMVKCRRPGHGKIKVSGPELTNHERVPWQGDRTRLFRPTLFAKDGDADM